MPLLDCMPRKRLHGNRTFRTLGKAENDRSKFAFIQAFQKLILCFRKLKFALEGCFHVYARQA